LIKIARVRQRSIRMIQSLHEEFATDEIMANLYFELQADDCLQGPGECRRIPRIVSLQLRSLS
jgi:hypothetical protein